MRNASIEARLEYELHRAARSTSFARSFAWERTRKSKRAATLLSLPPHHPTAEEACGACTNASFTNCQAGLCSDGSGEYCWCSPADNLPCPATGYSDCSSMARAAVQRRAFARERSVQPR